MAAPGFWDNQEHAREVITEANQLKGWVEPWAELDARGRELAELAELLEADSDADMEAEWRRELARLETEAERLEVRAMLSGADDARDALVTIHPGAGGTESQDWAEMLLRMYTRWAERHDFNATLLDLQPGEEAGIKSATIEVKGQYAYGYLKAEKGVHRLVRISPYDAQSRRHTSFASVFVYPVIDDSIEVNIEDKDLRIDTFRASGAGGQHVNKTSSAVRITHLPTNTVTACQNGAQPVPEQGHGHEDAAGCAVRARAAAAAGGEGQGRGGEDGHRLGQPDPVVRLPAVHAGHGSPHGAEGRRRAAGHGRRHRPVHREVPEGIRRAGRVGGAGGMEERRTQVVEDRLAKLEELRSRGIEPFGYRYDVTHHTAVARAAFEDRERAGTLGEDGIGDAVRLAGRVLSLRDHKRTVFIDLGDRDGRLQLYLRANDLGDAFSLVELLDPGDWIGVEGALFRTRMGEVTVRVDVAGAAGQVVRPLPFGKEELDEATGERRVWGGFADIEQRYRQRYADLAVHPTYASVFVPAPASSARSAASSMPATTSRSRRPCCSRCTAARRRGRSRPTTMRWTCGCTCASPMSCT
jgi:peptide chain release factor 2